MDTTMQAIEVLGTVDKEHRLNLDTLLPISGPRKVRVIVLYPLEDEENEVEWLKAAVHNPAFAFLKEEEEIYTRSDGKPFHDQG